MHIIKPFQMTGRVEEVLVAHEYGNHISESKEKVKLFQGYGVHGDNHAGGRLLDIRDTAPLRFGHPKGQECFNMRQWSAISKEEMEATAKAMGIEGIAPGLLGENLIVSGIPNFSQLPSGTLLFFKGPGGEIRPTILCVYAENGPCEIPGKAIQDLHPNKTGLKSGFIRHAKDRRGLVGWVMCSGFIKTGDTVVVHVPEQRLYQPPSPTP